MYFVSVQKRRRAATCMVAASEIRWANLPFVQSSKPEKKTKNKTNWFNPYMRAFFCHYLRGPMLSVRAYPVWTYKINIVFGVRMSVSFCVPRKRCAADMPSLLALNARFHPLKKWLQDTVVTGFWIPEGWGRCLASGAKPSVENENSVGRIDFIQTQQKNGEKVTDPKFSFLASK